MAKYLDGAGLSTAFGLIKNWVTTNFASITHGHGNITNGGDITATAPTVASGDKLIINDESASKITNGPSFGSDTTKYLRNDGSWAVPTGEANVQSDWNQGDTTADDYIKNKPGNFTGATGSAAGAPGFVPAPASGETTKLLWSDGNWKTIEPDLTTNDGNLYLKLYKRNSGTGGEGRTQVSSDDIPLSYLWPPVASASAAGLMSSDDFGKLLRIADGAEVNVQSDWNQTNISADDYIKNKPTIPTVPNGFANVKVGSTTVAADATADTLELVAGSNVTLTPDATNDKITIEASDTDTKNTAGATDSSLFLYLIGATGQGAYAQTYSHDTVWIATNGHLYSDSKQVVNVSGSQDLTNKTYEGFQLGEACEKGLGTVAEDDWGLVYGNDVYEAIQDALSDVAGALVYKGTAANASAISGTNYKKGWYWIASATFALTSGINVEPGDMIIAKQDKTSTFANDIDVVQTNIDTLTDAEVTALWNAA